MLSENIKQGVERAPNRSLLYALGYTEEEIAGKVGYKTAIAVHKRFAKIAAAYEDFVTAEYQKYLDK